MGRKFVSKGMRRQAVPEKKEAAPAKAAPAAAEPAPVADATRMATSSAAMHAAAQAKTTERGGNSRPAHKLYPHLT